MEHLLKSECNSLIKYGCLTLILLILFVQKMLSAYYVCCIYSKCTPDYLFFIFMESNTKNPDKTGSIFSGLDKDLDQWVFHPLLFNLKSILLHI